MLQEGKGKRGICARVTYSEGSKNEALEAFEAAPSMTSLEVVSGLCPGMRREGITSVMG